MFEQAGRRGTRKSRGVERQRDEVGEGTFGDATRCRPPDGGVADRRPSLEETTGAEVPALAGGEALVQLESAHLLRRIDHCVAV